MGRCAYSSCEAVWVNREGFPRPGNARGVGGSRWRIPSVLARPQPAICWCCRGLRCRAQGGRSTLSSLDLSKCLCVFHRGFHAASVCTYAYLTLPCCWDLPFDSPQASNFLFGAPYIGGGLEEPLFRILACGLLTASAVSYTLKVCAYVLPYCYSQ